MIPKKSIQPMELVISAIHCLRERKGSSPKEIVKYLEEKYDVCSEALKTEVEAGLKRGVSFGLINQKAGLYRLNDILSSPLKSTNEKPDKGKRTKIQKVGPGKRRKVGKLFKKTGRQASNKITSYTSQKRRKRVQNPKNRRKIKQRKTGIKGQNPTRQNDIKRRKFKRPKSKVEKTQKNKSEKVKKLQSEEGSENNQPKTAANGKEQSSSEQ